jgi:hypothetical protein
MCDRVLVFRQGGIEVELSGDLITEENLVRAAVGEAIQANHDRRTDAGPGTASPAIAQEPKH